LIRFTVPGIAAPKGSFKSYFSKGKNRIVVENDNPNTKPWENRLAWSAHLARGQADALTGPIVVYAAFYMPRPKSAPKDRLCPQVKPDKDKLLRATCDALKLARIYTDDQQVVFSVSRKAYAGGIDDPDGASGMARAFIAVGEYHPGRPQMFGLVDQLLEHVAVSE
jgi:crossover junction endodeoxyribonuclease RusA